MMPAAETLLKTLSDFAFTYNVRVLTKGCYYYQNSTDQIANHDDVAAPYYGNKIVKCSVHHLTTFFVGLFSPLADTDFTYEYVNEHIPVFITIYGSDADEVARELGTSHVKRNSSIFSWGISARFLLRTPWCLGDLRYVRLWVDNSGRGECESWYCNRVIIKDLHTGKIYRFPIYNWFGSFMGDGESERLAAVDNEVKMKNEVMSIHILAETISYIAMYTGGGLRTRQRVRRSAYSVSILMGQYIICFVNWAIAATGDYNGLSKRENLGLGITVTDGDLPKYWPYGLGIILELVLEYVLIGFFILNMGLTCSLPADAVEAFTHRYMIQLFLWIFITEPIKGMVAAYIILKRNPCHAISSDFDEAILPLEYGKNLSPPPECLRNDVVGTTDADIAQLNQNRDKKTREELLFETLRNVAYLLVALVITLGLVYFYRDVSGYYYQQQVQTLLNLPPSGPYAPQSFQSISQISQFWNWTQSTLVPSLAATWYDGNPAWGMRGFANDKVSREMGIGHIRQIRSLPMKECDVEPQLRQYFQNCSADISSSNEDRTPQYAAGWKKYNATADSSPPAEYRYQTAEELQSINIDGQLQSYSGGGYCVLLQGPNVDLMAELQKLQAENWIDKNTRAIFVEFSMYNAQVNYFSVVQLIIEIPSEGYLLPSSWVESVRLIRSQGSDGKIIVVFEFLYVIYAVLSFFVNTITYISNVVTAYQNRPPGHHIVRLFTHLFIARFWDLLDLFVGILAVLSVIAFFLREIYIDKALKNFAATNGNVYINLALQRNMELFFTFCLAGVVFFVACKMIKILRFNRRISVLANTLDYARVSITDFAVVFVIIICAFNASLYCLLWDRLASYQSVIATFATTTSGMLGKFVVANMFQISPLAFIIFMTFLYTATLILINIFVMIVLYEFKQVRCDSSRQTNEYEILEHIQTKIMRSVGLYGRHNMPACCVPDTLKDAELLNTLVSKTDLLLHRAYRWRVEDDDDDDMVIPGPRAQDLPKYAW
nr:Lipoxygenase and Polycystin cation channel domain containing protein [Haemonchus contortus]